MIATKFLSRSGRSGGHDGGARTLGLLASGFVFGFLPMQGATYDLLILGGQSNARGHGYWSDVSPHPADISSTVLLDSYLDPTVSANQFDNYYNMGPYTHDTGGSYFGPEIGYSRTMVDAGKNELAVVKLAPGGTSIEVWEEGATVLNGYMIDVVTRGIDSLVNQGHTVNVLGMAWLQGEADIMMPSVDYENRLSTLLSGWRGNLEAAYPGQYGFSSMPAALVEHADQGQPDSNVDYAMASIAASDPLATHIRTNDLLGYNVGDPIHFNSASQLEIGSRLADWACLTIPEPGTSFLALFAGGLALLRRRRL